MATDFVLPATDRNRGECRIVATIDSHVGSFLFKVHQVGEKLKQGKWLCGAEQLVRFVWLHVESFIAGNAIWDHDQHFIHLLVDRRDLFLLGENTIFAMFRPRICNYFVTFFKPLDSILPKPVYTANCEPIAIPQTTAHVQALTVVGDVQKTICIQELSVFGDPSVGIFPLNYREKICGKTTHLKIDKELQLVAMYLKIDMQLEETDTDLDELQATKSKKLKMTPVNV
jgi:hypothetical protein